MILCSKSMVRRAMVDVYSDLNEPQRMEAAKRDSIRLGPSHRDEFVKVSHRGQLLSSTTQAPRLEVCSAEHCRAIGPAF